MRNDVKEFWDEYAPEHMEIAYNFGRSAARYPFYETRLERLIELLAALPKGRILDAGCGGGQCMIPIADLGWNVYGCDSSQKMVDFAKAGMQAKGYDPEHARVGGVEDLSTYPDSFFDVIYSMGVIEYLTDEQERRFYAECRRVLKPQGTLVVEYINSLFDLLTFNRFTVNFFRKDILSKFFTDEATVDRLSDRIRGLVSNPDKPDTKGKYSTTRDHVYNRVENPITFAKRAKDEFGFDQSDLIFYRFHAVPPLLFENEPELEKVTIQFEKEYCRDWIGHFMASAFISVLRKG